MIFDEHRVKDAFTRAWSIHSSSRWVPQMPAQGQCSPTALVVQDLFGGTLLKTRVGADWHFYNRVGGRPFDFTADQFVNRPNYADEPATREEVERDCRVEQHAYLKQRFEAEWCQAGSRRTDAPAALTPADLHTLFVAAFNRGDVGALLALYEPQATVAFNGEAITGTERLHSVIESWLAASGRMQLETKSVVESGGEMALLQGRWTVEAAPHLGRSASCGTSTEVVRRQADGTWRFVIDSPHALS